MERRWWTKSFWCFKYYELNIPSDNCPLFPHLPTDDGHFGYKQKQFAKKKNPPVLLLPYGWRMGTFKINTLIIAFSFKERFIKFKIILIIQLIWLFWGAQIDRSISKMEKSIVLTLTQNWIWTSNPNRWIRRTWFGNLKLHVDQPWTWSWTWNPNIWLWRTWIETWFGNFKVQPWIWTSNPESRVWRRRRRRKRRRWGHG